MKSQEPRMEALLMTARELEKKLKALGYVYVRMNGSHKQFKHPNNMKLLSIPFHGGKDIQYLLNSVMKQAGLK
jgi:predicted RNA binding protein YcfA (HicA-like mRNA interferase family)